MNNFEQVKPVLMGAAAGALGAMLIGFMLFGWVTPGTADELADDRSRAAVVLALSKICVQQFDQQPDATASLDELKKLAGYRQNVFIEEGGWATMPGSEEPVSGVADACIDMLTEAAAS